MNRSALIACLAGLALPSIAGTARAQSAPEMSSPAASVNNAPVIHGTVQGDVQQMLPQNLTFDSSAQISGNVFVPGTPTVQASSSAHDLGSVNGSGNPSPSNYTVTVNGGATIGYLVLQTDPLTFTPISAPPAPVGTRDVTVTSGANVTTQIGNWTSLENLSLDSNVGAVSVPAGTYGTFKANSGSSFVLGTAGAQTAAVYSFTSIDLNSGAGITIVGPVILQVAGTVTLNGSSSLGNAQNAGWTTLNIASGGLTINRGGTVYAYVQAPTSAVTINGELIGSVVSANSLTINGSGELQYQAANVPTPTVSLTNPTTGSVVQQNVPVTVQASASVSSGTITEVDFYANNGQNNVEIGTTTSSPYSVNWTPGAGTYSLTAVAFSSQGASTISSPVTLDVNSAPSLKVGTSGTNNVVAAGGTLIINSGASDSDGTISLVQFYANGQLIGQSTTSPYNFSWADVAGGSYQVTVTATDNQGGVTTSSAFTVTSDFPPTVSLTAPATGTQVEYPASVVLSAGAADSDGTVASVTFFADPGSGPVQVGQSTQSPYTVSWQPSAPGNYTLTAVATDNLGLTTTSSAVQFKVGSPAPPPAMGSLSGGPDSTLIIKSDATVEGWGRNQFGQLGQPAGADILTPTAVSGITNAASLAMGSTHSLVLTSGGSVLSFGDNYFGQLGDGTTTDRATPETLTFPGNVISIAAGDGFSVAVTSDGRVWTWGSNATGQLGQGDQTDRLTPTVISSLTVGIKSVVAGRNFVVALTTTGGLLAWGQNQWGQVGDGSTTMRLAPVSIGGLPTITAVAAGANHVLAVDSSGNLWAWGENAFGQAGDASHASKLSPQTVTGVTGAKFVAAGWNHSLVATTSSSLLAFGANDDGQLGDGTVVDKPTPVTIPNVAAAVVGAGYDHSGTLASDHTLELTGRNAHGQLGNGNTTSTPTPATTTY